MKKPSMTKIKEAFRESREEAVVQNMLDQIRSNQLRIKNKEADIQSLQAENVGLQQERRQ